MIYMQNSISQKKINGFDLNFNFDQKLEKGLDKKAEISLLKKF